MLTASLITVLSSLLLVNAQNTQLETESIQAQFSNAHIVPDLIADFNPSGFLTVSFGGQAVTAGSPLTVDAVQAQPTIKFTAANSSVTPGTTFTVAMVDPSFVGASTEVTQNPTRHWLANNVTLGSDGTFTIPAEAITNYGAPLPAETDAPHRYTILVWQQPASFQAPADLSTPGQPITQFSLTNYVSTSGLGPVLSGWYFTCTRGTATATITTEAVDTATLPAAQSGGSGGSGSPTGTGTHSTQSASQSGAASSVSVGPAGILSVLAAAAFGIVVA